MVFHHVDEIRGRAAAYAAGDKFQRRVLGLGLFVGGDVLIFGHLRQHAVARLLSAVGMALGGGITVRRANHSREEGGFTGADLANVLAEVGLHAFAEAANRKAAAIAKINVIGVQLEDLALGEALVELGGHQDFLHLAAPFALGGEEESARHLHVYGAGALGLAVAGEVVKSGAENADHVEGSVFEEALVLGGEDGVDHYRRKVIEADHAALLAGAVEQIGDQLGFDLREIALLAVGKLGDAGDADARKGDSEGVVALEVGVRGGLNFDGRTRYMEFAGGAVDGAFLIPGAKQIGGEVIGAERLPDVNPAGSGVDTRGVLIDLPREALVDHAPELNVVIGERPGGGEQEGKDDAQHTQAEPGRPEAARKSNPQSVAPIYLEKPGHQLEMTRTSHAAGDKRGASG